MCVFARWSRWVASTSAVILCRSLVLPGLDVASAPWGRHQCVTNTPRPPWAAHTRALACTALQNITITFVLCDCDKRGKEVIFRGCINGFRWGWGWGGGQLDCISEVYLTAWVKLETNTLPWPCTFSQCSSTSTEQFYLPSTANLKRKSLNKSKLMRMAVESNDDWKQSQSGFYLLIFITDTVPLLIYPKWVFHMKCKKKSYLNRGRVLCKCKMATAYI